MTDAKDQSEPFVRMAAAVVLNKGGNFGGAFVIVPPDKAGEAVETLILDNNQSPAQFWAALKTKAEIRLSELIAEERQQAAFGTRR